MRSFHFFPTLRAELDTMFFHKGDDLARGRLCMLTQSIMCNISANLTGGAFYTGFLLGNDIDITDIGLITALPYLASLLSIFSPAILEHFAKRKWLLAGTRMLYYFINIVGLTLMPMLVHNKGMKVFWFGVIVLLGNSINFLFTSGYSVWHLNFIPDNVRAGFFSIQQFVNNLMGCGTAVVAGIAADSLAGSPYQLTIITGLRYAGFLFAVADVVILCIPREFPYLSSAHKVRLSDVFRLPLKHKKFVATISFYCLLCVINNLPSGVLNAYLLSTVHISYTQINLINVCYCLFVLAVSSHWQRLIRRMGWLRVFGLTTLLMVPTHFMYMLLQPGNALWLFTLLRFIQHAVGVGQNITASNLPFLNMPMEDRTNYVSFFNLIANLTLWLCITLGTWFVSLIGDFVLVLGPMHFDGMQLLFFIVACLSAGTFLLAKVLAPRLEPRNT